MDKKSKFRKLLATTSALAVIVGASNAMGAATRQTNANPANVGGGNAGLVAPFVDGDNVRINGAHNVQTAAAVDFGAGGGGVFGIDAGVNTGQTFTVNHVTGWGAQDLADVALIVNVGGTITIQDATTKAVTVNGGALIMRDISGAGANGNLNMTNGTATIRSVNNNTIFGNNAGVVLTVVDDAAAGFVGAVTTAGNGAANGGSLIFQGQARAQAGVGTLANALNSITINNGAVRMDAAVFATTLNVANANGVADLRDNFNGATVFNANGTVTLDNGKTITGPITTTSDTDAIGTNGGILIYKAGGNGSVVGAIGTDDHRLDTVEVTGAGILDVDANAHYARRFLLKNAGAIIRVDVNGKLTGDVVAQANLDGQIVFKGAGQYDGRIGDGPAGNGLAQFEANGVGIVKVGAGDHKAVVFTLSNAASEFEFADGANLTSKINNASGAANNTKVKFTGSGSVSGTTGTANALSELNLTGDVNSNVKFGDTIKATNVNIGAGTLEMNAAGNIAAITSFTDANTGRLLISGANPHDIGKIVTGAQAGGKGVISIANGVGANAVTFSGQIGDRAILNNSLKLLSIDSGNRAIFTANDSQIEAILFEANGGTLDFNSANSTYKIGGITAAANNKGTLKITEDTTFQSAANNAAVTFGTVDNRLARVQIKNGKTLVVGDGISIYATDVFGTVNGKGTLTFAGSSTFSAGKVDGNSILAINVDGGANKVVKLLDITKIAGNATINDNGTLEISNDFTAALLQGKGANNGTVRFTNPAAMTLTGAVGNGGNSLKAIEFAGGNVTFVGQVTHTAGHNFTFTDDTKAAMTVTFDAATNVGGNNFINSTNKGFTHTVVLGAAATDFANVKLAEDATKHINFQLDAAKAITLSGNTVATGAKFTTGTDGAGVLTLNTNNAGAVSSVGAEGKKLATAQFDNSMTVTNGLFATDVNVAAARTATVGGRILGTALNLTAAGSTVVLSDGAIVDTAIKGTVLNNGLVEFKGGVELNQGIGSVANAPASVTFADDAKFVQVLSADNIYAANILLRKGQVKLNRNIVLTGAATATSTPFILGDKKLTVAKGNTLTFAGDNTITLDVVLNGNVVTGGGQIESLGALEFGAGKLTINPNGGFKDLTGGASITTSVITSAAAPAAGKALDLTTVKVNTPDTFTKWTAVAGANGGLDLTIADRSEAAILEILGSSADAADKSNIAAITNAAGGTDGNKVNRLLREVSSSKDKVDETLDRLPPVTTVSDAVESTTSAVSSGMSQRMTNLAGSQGARVQNRTVASNGSASGIAAGDEGARYGVWASPFFGKTTQKENKGAAGYKSDAYGASFGFDTRANEDMIVGAAFTVANTEMKHKNFKSGDKTKISSMMFSIYGMQQITDSWFAHGVATFGSNEVKNAEKRVANLTGYDTVSGKYNSMSFNGEVMFGYNALTEQVTFTPMAGLRYSRVNDAGYKESGSTTGQNLDVNTKAANKLEAVVGVRVAGGTFASNGMTITPEIHGFVNHDLIGKNPKQSLGLAGTNGLVAKSNKPVKTTFNLGLGVNAEYGMMEYGAGYDAEIATKRLGHQGTLKIRVNF